MATTNTFSTGSGAPSKLPGYAGAFQFKNFLDKFLIYADKNFGHKSLLWLESTQKTDMHKCFSPSERPIPLETPGALAAHHSDQMEKLAVWINDARHKVKKLEQRLEAASNNTTLTVVATPTA
ncbi:hypothetical protein HK100_004869, partial [Physocladia obscura]